MREENRQLSLSLSIVIIFGFALSLAFLLSVSASKDGGIYLEKEKLASAANSSLPVRIKIPAINVDAPMEYVGLTLDGAMDVPKGPAEAAWYMLGPRPGEIGSAVLAGHSGWKNNVPAVFDDLHKLSKGDKIYIENEQGEILTFVVRENRKYNPDADATDVFGSNDGGAHLNLVTCIGIWNETEKSRSDRLVVFADKATE